MVECILEAFDALDRWLAFNRLGLNQQKPSKSGLAVVSCFQRFILNPFALDFAVCTSPSLYVTLDLSSTPSSLLLIISIVFHALVAFI